MLLLPRTTFGLIIPLLENLNAQSEELVRKIDTQFCLLEADVKEHTQSKK